MWLKCLKASDQEFWVTLLQLIKTNLRQRLFGGVKKKHINWSDCLFHLISNFLRPTLLAGFGVIGPRVLLKDLVASLFIALMA